MANMAGSDEGSGADAGRTVLDRRTLIKAGAVAGAAAWAVPQVVSMSAAAAASNACNSYFENFGSVVPGPPGYFTYTTGQSVAGWTVIGTSVDAVAYPQYNSNLFPAGTPAVIDLAGTPGPGGIERSYSLDCLGSWTVEFDWQRSAQASTGGTLTISGPGITTVVFPFGGAVGFAHELVAFATTLNVTSVLLSFFSPDTGNGNLEIGNISIHT